MTITRNFKLYLNAGTASAPYINVNQYDEGEEWVFTLYNEDGSTYTPSTGAIIGIKSDGNAIMNSGSVVGGKVVITETEQMTAASGRAIFELLIDNATHGTANFIVNVERRPSDDAEFSDSDLSMLQEAIDSAAEIEDLLGGQDVPTVITPIISDWLDENITNPSNPPIDTSLTVAGAAADAKAAGDGITDLKSAIVDSTVYQKHDASVGAKGNIVFPFIIKAGVTYTVASGSGGMSVFTQNGTGTTPSDVVEEVTNWLAANSSIDFTATVDATHIRAYCTSASSISIYMKNSIVNDVKNYVDNEKKGIHTLTASTASLTGYTSLDLQTYNSKQHNTASVYFEIDNSFTGIQFGRGFTKPYASGFCWVTPTTLEIYKYTTQRELVASVNHGLTLNGYVQITIEATKNNKGIFTVATGGGAYYTTEVDYAGCDTVLRVNPINCTITNVKMWFTDTDKKHKIWFFGDSYMDLYPPYLIELGYSNFALDGFSGRNSAEAWASLNFSIGYQQNPSTIIWALGMNDADSGAVNASWLENVTKVINLCNSKGIELILVTVPSTPTRDNTYKNNYIYNSGKRYCDVATAVEPSGSSTWYTGLLSSDNVHPTADGRKVIALRVIRDVPELINID